MHSPDFHYSCMFSVPSKGVGGLKVVTRSRLFGKGVCRPLMGTATIALKIFFHFLEERFLEESC